MQKSAQEIEYIVYQLEKMARKLDRTPLQDEFTKVVSRYWIEKNFGTYNNLLKHVGLEVNKDGVGRKKPSADKTTQPDKGA